MNLLFLRKRKRNKTLTFKFFFFQVRKWDKEDQIRSQKPSHGLSWKGPQRS